jgi:MoxR-like ATPase
MKMKKYGILALVAFLMMSLSISAQDSTGRRGNRNQPPRTMRMTAKERAEHMANVLELTSEQKEQVDRFMLKVVIGYPNKEEEKKIIRQNIYEPATIDRPVVTAADVLKAREVVREVYIDEKIEHYIVDIVFATRYPEQYGLPNLKEMIGFGASPRGSINLALAARAYAFIKHRGYVIPEDIRGVCHDVLRHRIGLTYEAEANNMTSEEIISEILNQVEVP